MDFCNIRTISKCINLSMYCLAHITSCRAVLPSTRMVSAMGETCRHAVVTSGKDAPTRIREDASH